MEFIDKKNWGPTPKYPLVRQYKKNNDDFIKIAGPCFTESSDQIYNLARIAAENGATHLRGGLFRAGTYPPEKMGWVDEELFSSHQKAAHDHGLKNIIEVLDYSPTSLYMINKYADCVQIGARGMQHYSLLKKTSEMGKQTFLKRHPGSTIDEWLGAAEYLLTHCPLCEPVLIERGGITHMNHVRYDLSISAIPAVRALTDLPIIVDASHGTGRRDLVEPMTLAGIAAGANGFLVEFHNNPEKSLSDAEQALSIESFRKLMKKINKLKGVMNEMSINW